VLAEVTKAALAEHDAQDASELADL